MGLKNFFIRLAGKKAAKEIGLKEGDVESKKWFQSKTIWSDVVTIAIGVYGSLRMTEWGTSLPPIPDPLLVFLGGFGIYGRKSASGPIR